MKKHFRGMNPYWDSQRWFIVASYSSSCEYLQVKERRSPKSSLSSPGLPPSIKPYI